jgi:hypothetical protein
VKWNSPVIFLSVIALLLGCEASHIPSRTSRRPAPPKFDKSLPLNYDNVRAQILEPKCFGCHRADAATGAETFLFDTYERVKNDQLGLWTEPPSESRVVQAIMATDKYRMPPPGKAPLSEDEIEYIVNWIAAGKPEF